MALELERFWRSQPPSGGINWGHPRARDLVFFAPLGLSHGLRDLVTGQVLTRTGLTSSVNSGGVTSHLFGSSSYADFSKPAGISQDTPFTIAWTQDPISATGYHTIFVCNFGTAGTHNQFVVYQSSSDSAYNFVVGPRGTGGSSANSPRFSTLGTTVNGQRDRFVLQVLAGPQSLTTSNYILWRNGQRFTAGSTASLGGVTAAIARIGARDTGADPFEGALQDMRLWSRVLTDPEAEAESRFERAAELYEPRKIWLPFSTSSGVSGTSATTNANDTSSASGTTTVTGTSATTNAADTSSASGTTTVVGTSATTNAADTSSASGSVGGGVSGTSATTNANDTSSASGTTTVVGTSATTNSNDSVSAAGWAGSVSGTSATTNANDTASASGSGGTVAPSTAPTPAGRARRRMVYVEIDGRPVVVGSEDEAVALLEKLEEKAEEVARVAVERASKATKRPTRKVLADARKTLEVPRISTPGRQDLGARYRERIREIYEQAAQAIEIAARMRDLELAIEADDEEVLLLL